MNFPTDYESIKQRIKDIEPVEYCRSRNFLDGVVTRLSPYISRGVISTKQVFNHVMDLGYKPYQIEKMLQELAWRDFWQQSWIHKQEGIDHDIRNPQNGVKTNEISSVLINAVTEISAIDAGIEELYETGYMHNHLRMYTAAIACNFGKNHWKLPAQWMYYHLLDADWASNGLSWQWVAGTNSNKQYIANQENINKYCKTTDKGTFLDLPYEVLGEMEQPEILKQTEDLKLVTPLPDKNPIEIDSELPTAIYTFYNLDPTWRKDTKMNRVLIMEPSFFEKYPSSEKVINFILDLTQNIENCQIFVGEFDEFISEYSTTQIYFKEHPTNSHFKGVEDSRDWIAPEVQGDFRSFFGYWKKVKKCLKL